MKIYVILPLRYERAGESVQKIMRVISMRYSLIVMPVRTMLLTSVTNECKNSFKLAGLPMPHQIAITMGFISGIPI